MVIIDKHTHPNLVRILSTENETLESENICVFN